MDHRCTLKTLVPNGSGFDNDPSNYISNRLLIKTNKREKAEKPQHGAPSSDCRIIPVSLLISFSDEGNEEGQAWRGLAEGF